MKPSILRFKPRSDPSGNPNPNLPFKNAWKGHGVQKQARPIIPHLSEFFHKSR